MPFKTVYKVISSICLVESTFTALVKVASLLCFMTSVNRTFVNVLPGGLRNFSLHNKEDGRLQESLKAKLTSLSGQT